jgi:SAM-dependent methyltransferase
MTNRWDKVYKDYHAKRFSVWNEIATPFFTDKIQFLKEAGIKKILDAGCGDGRNLNEFAKAGFDVTGIDYSAKACELASRVLMQYPKTKVICQDILDLQTKDQFDTILCDYVMVHLKDAEKAIENFFMALKPNGYLIIEFLSTNDPSFGKGKKLGKNSFINRDIWHTFYSLDEVKELLSAFRILEIQNIKHDDPDHVKDYPRSKPHQHDSIYVFCQKIQKFDKSTI